MASRYCKWFFSPSFCPDKQNQLIQTGAAFALRAASDILCHLIQKNRVQITFLQSITEHMCVLGLILISGHRFTSCYHQLAGCYKFLNIQKDFFFFPSILHINSGRMESMWHQKSWVLYITSSKLSGRGNGIYWSKYNQTIKCQFTACCNCFQIPNCVPNSQILSVSIWCLGLTSFYCNYGQTANLSLCDNDPYKLIKEVYFPC